MHAAWGAMPVDHLSWEVEQHGDAELEVKKNDQQRQRGGGEAHNQEWLSAIFVTPVAYHGGLHENDSVRDDRGGQMLRCIPCAAAHMHLR